MHAAYDMHRVHTSRVVQLGQAQARQLSKGACGGDPALAQHQQPVARRQVLPLVRDQHPRRACSSGVVNFFHSCACGTRQLGDGPEAMCPACPCDPCHAAAQHITATPRAARGCKCRPAGPAYASVLSSSWQAGPPVCGPRVRRAAESPMGAPCSRPVGPMHCWNSTRPTRGSTADSGSSSSATSGRAYAARASASRAFCPPAQSQ